MFEKVIKFCNIQASKNSKLARDNVLHEASKQFGKCYICIFSFEKCNFCFHLELCKLVSLPLFMMSTLEILAPPLSLSKRREDPYINFHIMTKVSIILICASLQFQCTNSLTLHFIFFFMHDTEKSIIIMSISNMIFKHS